MAPLKLKSIGDIAARGKNFHDYFVMAPLKLRRNTWHWGDTIRTSMTILSWPHWSTNYSKMLVTIETNFHDYFVMAPLKRKPYKWQQFRLFKLPWLFCHGPIEANIFVLQLAHFPRTSMTILSWPHWSHSHFQILLLLEWTSMTILSWPHWSSLFHAL